MGLHLGSFDDLERYLRTFVNWKDPEGQFDFVGAVCLLAASLDCLRDKASEADLEELADCLNGGQTAFLVRVAGLVSAKKS